MLKLNELNLNDLKCLSFQLFSNNETTNLINGSVLNKNKKFGQLIPSSDPLLAFDIAGLPNKLPTKYNLIKSHKSTIKKYNIECNNYCVVRDNNGMIYNMLTSFCNQFAITTLYISKKYKTYFTIINDKGSHCTTTIYNNARNSYEQICDIIENNKIRNITSEQHSENLRNHINSYMVKHRLTRDQREWVYTDFLEDLKHYCKTEFNHDTEQPKTQDSLDDDNDLDELLKAL